MQPVAVCPHHRVLGALHVANGANHWCKVTRRPWPARVARSPSWTPLAASPQNTAALLCSSPVLTKA